MQFICYTDCMKQKAGSSTESLHKKQSRILLITISLLIFFLLVSLVGNVTYFQLVSLQREQNNTLLQQNALLQNQMRFLNSQLLSLDEKAKKYLLLQGESCTQSGELCLDSVIIRLETKPALTVATGGLCLVRDGNTDIPSSSDPDVGKGYAKLTKTGINTVSGLRESCDQADYAKLMQTYCAQNTSPASLEVATVNTFGGVTTSACSSFGCGSVGCPRR